jgi:hypothetical protein
MSSDGQTVHVLVLDPSLPVTPGDASVIPEHQFTSP